SGRQGWGQPFQGVWAGFRVSRAGAASRAKMAPGSGQALQEDALQRRSLPGEVGPMRRSWGRWVARVTIWLLGSSALFVPTAAAFQASFLLGLESYARGWTQAGQELVEEAAADPANTEARLIFGMMQWA